jgi:hypothetical protein
MSLYHSMDQLVSDHHRFDFLVEREGNMFRPWVTIVQDFRSSKIVGFCPSVYPNSLNIAVSFFMAVSQYGACKVIHLDNGKDYRSEVLNGKTRSMRVLNESGLEAEERVHLAGAYSAFSESVTYARPYHGQSKGRTERTFGIWAERFSREIPTYVGSNTTERPEDAALFWRALNKRAKRNDIYPWDDFVLALTAFIADYNASWHSSGNGMNGQTPNEVFDENRVEMRPVDPDALALALSRSDIRLVRKNGVRIDGVNFWAPELMEYQGREVLVRRPIATPEDALICDIKGAVLCRAKADFFLETGDMEADNAKINKARRETLKMVRERVAGKSPEVINAKGRVERLLEAAPKESQEVPLALAAGAEDLSPKPVSGSQDSILELLSEGLRNGE